VTRSCAPGASRSASPPAHRGHRAPGRCAGCRGAAAGRWAAGPAGPRCPGRPRRPPGQPARATVLADRVAPPGLARDLRRASAPAAGVAGRAARARQPRVPTGLGRATTSTASTTGGTARRASRPSSSDPTATCTAPPRRWRTCRNWWTSSVHPSRGTTGAPRLSSWQPRDGVRAAEQLGSLGRRRPAGHLALHHRREVRARAVAEASVGRVVSLARAITPVPLGGPVPRVGGEGQSAERRVDGPLTTELGGRGDREEALGVDLPVEHLGALPAVWVDDAGASAGAAAVPLGAGRAADDGGVPAVRDVAHDMSPVKCSCPTVSRPTVECVAAIPVPVRSRDRNRRRARRSTFWVGAASISFDGGADLRRLARSLAARPRGGVYGVRVVITAVEHSAQQVAEEARLIPVH